VTSFLYIVSIAYHTSVPALWKCMDTSRKKVIWLIAQPLMHHLLLSDLKDLPPIASERSKDMKVTGGKVWRVQRMWKTLERQILDCCSSWTGSMGRALSCCNKTPLLRSLHFLDLIADTDDSLGDMHTLHCSQCSTWTCSAPRLPLAHPKRESA
jgi:hypothetical protein